MKKIITVVIIFSLLFFGGFFFQTKYFHKLSDNQHIEYVNDNLWLKEVGVLDISIRLVDLLIGSITFFVSTMLILLIIILANRKRMENRQKKKEYLLEEYQKMILDYLENNKIDKERFRKIADKSFERQILIDQIIDISLNLPKDKKNKIKNLYFELNLLFDTINKLMNKKWHLKIKAFKELSSLGIESHNDIIQHYVNSKNDILRMEAQIALVKLSNKENPFDFLSTLNYPFSLWEQITLHELMVHEDIKAPNFYKWLNSKNDTVVMFCLRMIKEYNHNLMDSHYCLINVFNHKNPKVRNLAIKVVGDLGILPLHKNLRDIFDTENYENKLQIIKSIGKNTTLSSLKFLKDIVDDSDDVQFQIEALKAIKNVDKFGEETLNNMMKSSYKNYNILIKHVLDNRIN